MTPRIPLSQPSPQVRWRNRRHFWTQPVIASALALLAIQFMHGQSTPNTRESESQKSPSGKISFDVASIRLDESGTFLRPSMALNNEDTPVPPGGRLVADFPLLIYIEFAYKIMPTRGQEESMVAHLPNWVRTERFVIQAQADGNPTKDQIRLMMQSLLADRFKLAVHFETKVAPVLAMVLDRPATLGPGLRHHEDGPACDSKLAIPTDRTSLSVIPGGFIRSCGLVQAIDGPDHSILIGGRNLSLEHFAGYLTDFQDLGRPVVDQTGLDGTFDFSLSWSHDRNKPVTTGVNESTDVQGPNILEALKEQLGLKLKPTRAPVQTLMIDHIEQPSPN